MTTSYTLTKPTLHKLIKRYGVLTCHACGKPLTENQVVISKASGRCRRKLYHVTCWESLRR